MVLILHIIVALASVGLAANLFFRPSQPKLYVSYGLVASTLVSGIYLIASTNAHILHACLIGIFYLGIVSAMIAGAGRKLAVIRLRSSK